MLYKSARLVSMSKELYALSMGRLLRLVVACSSNLSYLLLFCSSLFSICVFQNFVKTTCEFVMIRNSIRRFVAAVASGGLMIGS